LKDIGPVEMDIGVLGLDMIIAAWVYNKPVVGVDISVTETWFVNIGVLSVIFCPSSVIRTYSPGLVCRMITTS
jgi:hypothetical protein